MVGCFWSGTKRQSILNPGIKVLWHSMLLFVNVPRFVLLGSSWLCNLRLLLKWIIIITWHDTQVYWKNSLFPFHICWGKCQSPNLKYIKTCFCCLKAALAAVVRKARADQGFKGLSRQAGYAALQHVTACCFGTWFWSLTKFCSIRGTKLPGIVLGNGWNWSCCPTPCYVFIGGLCLV